MSCSTVNAPIINLQHQLSQQNGYIPPNAIYEDFFVVAASISEDLLSIQATLLLRIKNAPIYQFTINATLNSNKSSIQSTNFNYLTAIYNNYQTFQMYKQDIQMNVNFL
jgi:hypothetical protein